MSLSDKLSLIIVILLAVDVVLEYKMVYGRYPWEMSGV